MGHKRLKFRTMKDLLATVVVIVSLIAIILVLPTDLPENLEGIARVTDGDSLVISGTRIRLIGVDAPEGRQYCTRNGRQWACGEAAARALRQKISNQPITCEAVARDQFDRVLARCRVGSENLNAWLVRNGWAVSYGAFAAEERAAKQSKRGIWSGSFQFPRDWRDENRR